MNEGIRKKVGLSSIVITVLGALFFCYQYFDLKKQEKAAILITDKVGMTIRVDYLHEDKMHSVDAINVYTSETFYDVPTSKFCPKYSEFKIGTEVDVVQISYLNGKTGETWKEYDGLYQRVCIGDTVHNFSNKEDESKKNPPQPSIIPNDDSLEKLN